MEYCLEIKRNGVHTLTRVELEVMLREKSQTHKDKQDCTSIGKRGTMNGSLGERGE